jgi:hypothetical protein
MTKILERVLTKDLEINKIDSEEIDHIIRKL